MTRTLQAGAALALTLAAGLSASSAALAQGAAPTAPAESAAPAPGVVGPKTPLPPRDAPRAPQTGQKPQAQDVDWPCVQRKVGSLSYGQMWAGPPLEDALGAWRDDKAVSDLVPLLIARRTPMEEAKAEIEKFAKEAGDKKKERLTLLFAGVFDELNAQRSHVVNGIDRYAQKQRELANRIKDESIRMASEQRDMASQNSEEGKKKQEALDWDTRIYDERAQSLTYVCESPVLYEQRAFDLGREIQSQLE